MMKSDAACAYATGATVRNALAEARRLLGLTPKESREVLRSGEDGLYRCHLESGHIIEVTIVHRGKTFADFIR